MVGSWGPEVGSGRYWRSCCRGRRLWPPTPDFIGPEAPGRVCDAGDLCGGLDGAGGVGVGRTWSHSSWPMPASIARESFGRRRARRSKAGWWGWPVAAAVVGAAPAALVGHGRRGGWRCRRARSCRAERRRSPKRACVAGDVSPCHHAVSPVWGGDRRRRSATSNTCHPARSRTRFTCSSNRSPSPLA